jgi:hypothetical protein
VGQYGEVTSVDHCRTGEPAPHGEPAVLLLIDCKEDRTLRAVLVGMLREAERSGPS